MPKQSWVKLLYFYAVIGVSILFLSIGTYILSSTLLKKYVFTEIGSSQFAYSTPELNCRNGSQFSPKPASSDSSNPQTLTDQQLADCVKQEKDFQTKQESRQFQEDTLNSILTILISGIVLLIHVFLFRRISSNLEEESTTKIKK